MFTKGYIHTTFMQTFYQHSIIIWNIICSQEIHILTDMETYNLIIAGTIGSVITLFMTAIIDFFKEMYRASIEERLYFRESLKLQKMQFHGFKKA